MDVMGDECVRVAGSVAIGQGATSPWVWRAASALTGVERVDDCGGDGDDRDRDAVDDDDCDDDDADGGRGIVPLFDVYMHEAGRSFSQRNPGDVTMEVCAMR